MLSLMQQASYPALPGLQSLGYADVDGGGSAFGGPFLQNNALSLDPNSPEAFKQNIQVAQTHVLRVQNLARSALMGIENAYNRGTNPVQTTADVAALKQALLALEDTLRQTGVGALPLVSRDAPEEQLVAEAAQALQALYQRQHRMQESAGVVVGLLGAVEQNGRR